VAWQVSIRRACAALQAERSSYHYKGKRTDQADLKARIKQIAETRVRYGYRRITVLLKREGWPVNGKRIYRLYKALGLQLRNKTPKRKVKAKLRDDRRPATRPNDIWAMDFLHDELFDGRKIRILAVVDTFSRFSPALDPRFAYKAADIVETLERIGKQVGIPRTSVSTTGRSSSPKTSIFGPFNGTSPWCWLRRPSGQPAWQAYRQRLRRVLQ
jgi:putative transposase